LNESLGALGIDLEIHVRPLRPASLKGPRTPDA
jgi:hypothetical protein